MMDRSIRAVVHELAQQQEMVAVWDDAIIELSKSPMDLKWIDANIGVWLSRTFGQEEVYILNDRNEGFAAGNNRGLRAATGELAISMSTELSITVTTST
jgi:sensor domain CHASE-containing protein